MELSQLKDILESNGLLEYTNLKEVEDIDILLENSDSYMIKNNNIIGFHFTNLDLSDIIYSLLDNQYLLYLKLNNVGIDTLNNLHLIKQLQILYLYNISVIPQEITKLTNLTSLNLSNNNIAVIPQEITKLTNLTSLNLGSNNISVIPNDLFMLKRLISLKLKDNLLMENEKSINNVLGNFVKMKILREFKINTNYLKPFYQNAYKINIQEFRLSILQLKNENTSRLYASKILFVGEPGAGKTSLMEKIINDKYKLKTKDEDQSTLGIDIREYAFPYKFNGKEIDFKAKMWDFGGQQIQYMSHQFFLTPNSLYILVADDRKQHTEFDYWFHIINLLTGNSPILVVLNEINHKSITNFELSLFKDEFKTHRIEENSIDLNKIDENRDRGRYNTLISVIKEMITTLPHVGMEFPATWVNLQQSIQEEAKNNKYISYDRFEELLQDCKIDKVDAKRISIHFHNIGIFLYYGDDYNGLSDIIFLDPKWLMDGIYSVLADKTVLKNNGKFKKKWLYKFWDNHKNRYRDSIKNKLLTLMLKDKFEICYKLNATTFISPQLLSAKINYNYTFDSTNNLKYVFEYPFMPKGIMSRLIVRLNELIYKENNEDIVWQRGVILTYRNAKASISENKTSKGVRAISISLNGNAMNRKELLGKIKTNLEDIHNRSFKNIIYSEMIPCYCDKCKEKDNPFFFPYDLLKEYINDKKSEIECQNLKDRVHIAKLLGDVIDDNSEDTSQKEMKDVKNNINVNVNVNPNINVSVKNAIDIKIEIKQNILEVIKSLNELEGNSTDDEKKEIIEIKKAFSLLRSQSPSKSDCEESGSINKIENFLKKFNDVADQSKNTIENIKSLAQTYNKFARFTGITPVIPEFLLQ
jgi:small GTP-binding protein